MRPIKFRGQRVDTKAWIYGGFHLHKEVALCIATKEEHDKNTKAVIVTDGMADWNLSVPITCYEVIPETVGEFTGLLDKNGKEIYEGDVVRGVSANEFSKGDMKKYKVVWGVDSWHIEGTYFSLQELFNYCNTNVEVIGNIYENPEPC